MSPQEEQAGDIQLFWLLGGRLQLSGSPCGHSYLLGLLQAREVALNIDSKGILLLSAVASNSQQS